MNGGDDGAAVEDDDDARIEEEDDTGVEDDDDARVDENSNWAAADLPVFSNEKHGEQGEGPAESEPEEGDVMQQEGDDPVDDDEGSKDYHLGTTVGWFFLFQGLTAFTDVRAGLVFIPTQPNSPGMPVILSCHVA